MSPPSWNSLPRSHRIPQRKNRGLRLFLCILSALLWIYSGDSRCQQWGCLSSTSVLSCQVLAEPWHPSLCYSDVDNLDLPMIQRQVRGCLSPPPCQEIDKQCWEVIRSFLSWVHWDHHSRSLPWLLKTLGTILHLLTGGCTFRQDISPPLDLV